LSEVLKIKEVSKTLGNRKVVDNISLEVHQNEIVGFLGANGAGKTTTIKMVLGLLSIDSGEIYIHGHGVKHEFEKALENVGGIVESPDMYGYMSGLDNLKLSANARGVNKNRIQEVISLVGLDNRIKDKVGKYSLGMKQRIGLAQSMLHRPSILVLDEPTNGLDPVGIKELRGIIKKLAHEQETSVLVSSHILSEMQLMCDRVCIIDRGKILITRSVAELEELSGHSGYRFIAKPIDVAIKIIKEKLSGKLIASTEKTVDVNISESEINNLTQAMISEGVSVLGVSPIEKSLEEIYMKITGGDNKIG